MPAIIRDYKGKDAEMLIAISTITETAITNKVLLISKRANWADPFFANLKIKIDTAVQTYLGADNAKSLRLSTQALLLIEKSAMKDLAEFKVGIEVDYSNDKPRMKEILTQLGFTAFLKKAQNKDQEALINLLYQFKTNMIVSLQTEIVAKGTSISLINNINAYANTLKSADVTQEGFKGTRKTATVAAIKEFNSCYSLVIGVCKLSTKYFRDQPDIKSQFSYSKVLKTLNVVPSPPTPPVTPP